MVLAEIRALAKKEGIKVKFKRLKGAIAGQSHFEENLIVINSLLSSRAELLSTWCHEKVHFDCYKKGLWHNYHQSDDPKVLLKTALKAERFIDRLAAIELYKIDKRCHYLSSYDIPNEEAKEFLKNYYEDQEQK